MVIDSSAILAILSDEPERAHFNDLIEKAPQRVMAAPVYLETAMVIEARNRDRGALEMDLFYARAAVEILPFTRDLAEIARLAFRLYGKGRHPAKLNFGDCVSYALAKSRNDPLLCKGDDFPLTDLRIA
jgi:ribonuclease VapC